MRIAFKKTLSILKASDLLFVFTFDVKRQYFQNTNMANLEQILIQNVINNIENAENQQRFCQAANDAFELSDYKFIKMFSLRK
jgi:hypothetical protein